MPDSAPPTAKGATVWLTGLPSAGKSTIAATLAGRLRAAGTRVEVLDGDEVRTFLSAGLGFSRADRDTQVLRIGFVADLLARNGVVAITAAISPYADTRAQVRRMHEKTSTDFLEVYVATPLAECTRRDVKGLYARQAAGEMSGLTGVDDPYEPPEQPELVVQTMGRTADDCAGDIVAALAARGVV